MTNMDRIPPQNLDAERAVLGACLLGRDGAQRALEAMPGDPDVIFYQRRHAKIWRVVRDLADDDEAIDQLPVSAELGRRRELEEVGVI
ncbi:MAG: hypothetical protein O2782_03795 [bacterium]|nr:hypothetical protein [bacterium]